ncbi:GNAT family N-acetyltransferase [Vibrio coralliilyticus]|uniref:GNAT family N-acetyltransferase n=1 Tax=Vibrio coralliilyticus TaxID=190893 RepID=UPI000B218EBF|nr:GNAT family N-acetyltransferase [Vibrio coralliilyticus]QOU32488.1 GNAT family N-acetyltransferase [Vibrio coralliilyticus]
MSIQLLPISKQEFPEVFPVVKQALYEHVDSVFVWDDQFQQHRLSTDYQPEWFHWVVSKQNKIGLVCFKPYDTAYHIHLLILFPQYQNQGFGHIVMQQITTLVKSEGRNKITLSSFTRNTKAIQFYTRLGYQVTEEDECFVSMTLDLEQQKMDY